MRLVKNIVCLFLVVLSMQVNAKDFFKLARANDEGYCSELMTELNKKTKVVGTVLLFKQLQTAKGVAIHNQMDLAPTPTEPDPYGRSVEYQIFDIDNDNDTDLVFKTMIPVRGGRLLSDWYVKTNWNSEDLVKQYLESINWIYGKGFDFPMTFPRPLAIKPSDFKFHQDANNEILLSDYQNHPISFKDKNLILVDGIDVSDGHLVAVRFENKEQMLSYHFECLFNYKY